ncbi:MAG: hypothetical protein LBC80_07220 [Treponema sp.]|jgi:RNA polymerase subunit RPABC4/transcription elongation factor Spt4|nr:hypothetical protein [Treponema sp.]
MGIYIQILALVIISIILLWFGYTLFLGPLSPFYRGFFLWSKWEKREQQKGEPGDPQVCPVCSIKLYKGELVKSVAFPSISGGIDRLMYIKGCFSCLNDNVQRRCPVCNSNLSTDDFLVSRMFERMGRKNHVHVLGCNRCKRINLPSSSV